MPIITIPSINIVEDVELTLNSISPAEEYEAGQDPEQKKFIWTFDFTMKANFYGPITQGKIITTAITQLYSNTDTSLVEAPNSNNLSNAFMRITVTPDPANSNASVIASDEDYGFSTSWLEKYEE